MNPAERTVLQQRRLERREVAFFAIMMLWRERRDEEVAKKVQELITDLPDIHGDFENFINPPPQKKSDEWDIERKRRREKRERNGAARIKNWEEWRNDIQARQVEAFSEKKRSNTLANFFTWLDMAVRENTSWARWSSEIVSNVFTEDFIKHLLPALSQYWRQIIPQTWSEKPIDEKHSTLSSAIHALSATKSEAKTPGWENKLSRAEAELAAKLSMIELNGFAAYLGSLEEAHQSIVHAVILRELEIQVRDLGAAGQSPILHDLCYHGSDTLKSAAANRLLVLLATWPNSMLPGTQDALRYAANLIAGHAERGAREALAAVFETKIKCSKRFSIEHQHWLHAFVVVSPNAGCRRLLADTQDTTDQEAVRFGMCVIGGLYGDRHYAGKRPDFTELEISERAELLAALVRRIYEVAHPSTDIRHQGCYSPGARDFAEEARRFLFDNLTKTECVETYKALSEFSELKTFEHMKSRLLQMRAELAANASEPDAMHTSHLILFEKENIIVPNDNRSMHQTMLNRLDDYEHFILESEFSNRSTLQLVDEETELRRNIANWLNDHSRSIYRVNQEAVKVHEKGPTLD